MSPDIAFGMKLWGLLNALEAFDFRQQVNEKAALVQQLETATRATFREDTEEFVANALDRDPPNKRGQALDRLHCFRLNRKVQTRSEAYGAQHAQVIFVEALFCISNRADNAAHEIGFSADVIEHLARNRIFHEAIDGEVPPLGIESRIRFESNRVGPAPVGVPSLTTEGRDFYVDSVAARDKNHAKVSSYRLRARKNRKQLFRSSVCTDVVILGRESK